MIRSIKRNMARNRLKDMGYDKVNKRMGIRNDLKGNRVSRVQIRNGMKTPASRDRLSKFLDEHPAVWKRVLVGDLAKKAKAAEKAASRQRKIDTLYRC